MSPPEFRLTEVEHVLYVLIVLLGGALLSWVVLDYLALIETVAENAPW